MSDFIIQNARHPDRIEYHQHSSGTNVLGVASKPCFKEITQFDHRKTLLAKNDREFQISA